MKWFAVALLLILSDPVLASDPFKTAAQQGRARVAFKLPTRQPEAQTLIHNGRTWYWRNNRWEPAAVPGSRWEWDGRQGVWIRYEIAPSLPLTYQSPVGAVLNCHGGR